VRVRTVLEVPVIIVMQCVFYWILSSSTRSCTQTTLSV